MPKFAVIDIGTNAVKFHLAEKNHDGTWSTILDRSEVTRLGEGLHLTGKINDAALERSLNSIKKFVEIARDNEVQSIVAVGTMALRSANNAYDFIKQIAQKCGINVEIISGEEEARLSALAVTSSLSIPRGDFIIFDIGGGSIEFIFGHDTSVDKAISLNIGVVRLIEQILKSDPVTDNEFNRAIETIEATFNTIDMKTGPEILIGVGATMTILGAMKFKRDDFTSEIIHGSKLKLADVVALVELLKSKTIKDRKEIVGLPTDRADVILPGAMIIMMVMKHLGTNFVTISNRGVRHGLLIDRFG